MTTGNMGRYGKIGLALMTDNGALPEAPTVTLRTKQFAAPMPEYTRTTDEIADGTRFGEYEFVQGVTAGTKDLQAGATLRDAPLLLTAMLGTAVAGVITPRASDFGALMPGQPLAVWQPHPLRDSLFPAAQLSKIVFNIQNRNNVDMTVTLNTARTEKIVTMPVFPPIAATGVLQFLHTYVTLGGKKYAISDGTITLEQPLEAEDGAQGLNDDGKMYIIGWAASGALKFTASVNMTAAGAGVDGESLKSLMALGEPDPATGNPPTVAAELGFKIGEQTLAFNLPTARVWPTNPPNGLGKLTLGVDIKPVPGGNAGFTVTLPTP